MIIMLSLFPRSLNLFIAFNFFFKRGYIREKNNANNKIIAILNDFVSTISVHFFSINNDRNVNPASMHVHNSLTLAGSFLGQILTILMLSIYSSHHLFTLGFNKVPFKVLIVKQVL